MTRSAPGAPPPPDDGQPKTRGGSWARAGRSIVGFFDGVTKVAAAIAAVLAVGITIWGIVHSGSEQPTTGTRPDPAAPEQSSAYRKAIGDICVSLNRDGRAIAKIDRELLTEIRRARGLRAVKGVLLEGQNSINSSSGAALAQLEGLDVPPALKARHDQTVNAWKRNLQRLESYAQRFDAAQDLEQSRAAFQYLSRLRPRLRGDAVTVNAGLRSLGAGRCRRERPPSTRPLRLPRLGVDIRPEAVTPYVAAPPP